MNAGKEMKRHAAVRPDVFAGNQRLRTWLYKPWLEHLASDPRTAAWIAELGGDRYLCCDLEGRTRVYECRITPDSSWTWEELK